MYINFLQPSSGEGRHMARISRAHSNNIRLAYRTHALRCAHMACRLGRHERRTDIRCATSAADRRIAARV